MFGLFCNKSVKLVTLALLMRYLNQTEPGLTHISCRYKVLLTRRVHTLLFLTVFYDVLQVYIERGVGRERHHIHSNEFVVGIGALPSTLVSLPKQPRGVRDRIDGRGIRKRYRSGRVKRMDTSERKGRYD